MAEFCLRRKRNEKREVLINNRDMFHPPHGVHVSPIQRCAARTRGPMPEGARPRGGCAQWDLSFVNFGPRGGVFGLYHPSGPCFPRGDRYLHNGPHFSHGDHYPPSGPHFPFHGDRFASWPWMIFQLTLFLNKWSNTSMIHSLITLVLSQLPILCLSIEQVRGLENI